jgi:hypothetical protein
MLKILPRPLLEDEGVLKKTKGIFVSLLVIYRSLLLIKFL